MIYQFKRVRGSNNGHECVLMGLRGVGGGGEGLLKCCVCVANGSRAS